MKLRFFDRYLTAARRLPGDEEGIVLIWVTIMLVAIIGLAGLALDASRYRSLKTQMQAGADALALAGARELDGSNGSIMRATSAINTMISNTPQGMGTQSKITAATITFYSSLYAASDASIGAVTTNPNLAKYVGVTVAPASADAILPLPVAPPQVNAMAVAGYDFAVCNMPPVFICNPYEQPGDDDATATAELLSNLKDPNTNRQQIYLSVNGGSGYGPGHFGFLMPPDGCSGASCLRQWIATYKPKACYRKKNVDLNTGQMQSVFDAFNVRFDMYGGDLKNTNGDYPPAANVRKGYQAKGGNWCNAAQATPYLTTRTAQSYSIIEDTGDVGVAKNNCNGGNAVACTVSNVSDATIENVKTMLQSGSPAIVGAGIPSANVVTAACSVADIQAAAKNTSCYELPQFNTLVMNHPSSAGGTGVAVTVGWPTSGMPRDAQKTSSFQGNGQWDCANYWAINHPGANIPSDPLDPSLVCGDPATTTYSRWDIYNYEIDHGLVTDFSFPGLSRSGVDVTDSPLDSPAGAENGAPKCSTSQPMRTDDGGGDRRTIYAAAINCYAQAAKMNQGGQTANDVPVAGFVKFFLTEPADTANQILIGEMTGAVGLDKNAKNNVQLYR